MKSLNECNQCPRRQSFNQAHLKYESEVLPLAQYFDMNFNPKACYLFTILNLLVIFVVIIVSVLPSLSAVFRQLKDYVTLLPLIIYNGI
jgi:hypothetical protein